MNRLENSWAKLKKLILKGLLMIMASYPIMLCVNFLLPGNYYYEKYQVLRAMVWDSISDYIFLIVVSFLAYYLASSRTLYSKLRTELRRNHLDTEVLRWNETPYIAPAHLYNLFFPKSFERTLQKRINDFSYRYTVDYFRYRIYNNVNYTKFSPAARGTLHKLFSTSLKKVFRYIFILLLTLTLMIYLYNGDSQYVLWFTPALVYVARRVFTFLFAYLNFRYDMLSIDKFFEDNYGDPEPKIKWSDLSADKHLGRTIMKVWKDECLSRQNLYNHLLRRGENHTEFDCPSLASKPYENDIPEWVSHADKIYHQKKCEYFAKHNQVEWVVNSKTNVVSLNEYKLRNN
ncbi:hypothetical protein OM416_19160 [Paenibacillus sp. LS1]|uniref:hypothetical protein n=1 Tax=Paenibacillus sp. LS1 TaxID=2992120 RepID=UPI00222FBC73|nr:hypothetical protein [Paenibacillus sp. LS1]MCW3793715.1 hypothetical protein [Paenibacillus sp. LS1]